MSEQDNPATEEAPEAPESGTEENAQATESDEFDKDRALEKIRKTNSENAQLRKRLKEFEDANKSEADKQAERLSTAEKSASEATTSALRFEVALDLGLTKAQAKRLVGSNREELEADAKELLETFGGNKPPTRKPTEKLRGGADPDDEPDESDPRKLAALIKRRT